MMTLMFAAVAALMMGASAAHASGMALIYENEQAVTAGRSWPALVSNGGAAMPSDSALASANALLYGDAEGLFRASIARLDNDLNIALVRRGERIGNEDLQAAHQGRWLAASQFLNLSTVAAGAPDVVTVAPVPGGAPFAVRINGIEPGSVPLLLPERFKKSKFRLEVVNTSTAPVWGVSVKISANPTLSFWKEGRRQGLNDVPSKTFEYVHQAVFKPLKPGESFKVPVEIYFIKERDYLWTIQVKSKGVETESRALVRFE